MRRPSAEASKRAQDVDAKMFVDGRVACRSRTVLEGTKKTQGDLENFACQTFAFALHYCAVYLSLPSDHVTCNIAAYVNVVKTHRLKRKRMGGFSHVF